MNQDILPPGLFDMNIPWMDMPTTQPPQTSSLSKFTSRLPQPLDDIEDNIDDEDGATGNAEVIDGDVQREPWSMTESDYDQLCREIHSVADSLPPAYSIPSKDALTRYLEIYMFCIYKFLPFIHPATFSVREKDAALVLAVAAIASLHRFDHPTSYTLYFAAKAILLEKIRREDVQVSASLLSGERGSTPNSRSDLGTIQTLILLTSFASWADKTIVHDALSMASQLAARVRESGISKSDEMPPNVDWLSWIAIEERRRTLLSAYVVFNLHSIAFDIPPLILSHEVGVSLPGYGDQWAAKSAAQWRRATRQVECRFQGALKSLFAGHEPLGDSGVSSFANYVLIHGLLQQIYMDRHGSPGLLRPEALRFYETVLSAWQLTWEHTDETSLNPLSPKGPLGLSATALFRLAYIRLNSDISPCQGLLTRDVRCITGKHIDITRSPHICKAVLQAAHALSIPVRLGIEYVARAKPPIWTIEHSICSLECALLLRDWLEALSSTARSSGGTSTLCKTETKLVGIIASIIKETAFADTLNFLEDDAARYQRMASTVLKVWARIFQGVHILDIDNVIGASLQLLAEST